MLPVLLTLFHQPNIVIQHFDELFDQTSHVLKDFQIEGYPKRKHNHIFFTTFEPFSIRGRKKADKIPRSHQLFLQS